MQTNERLHFGHSKDETNLNKYIAKSKKRLQAILKRLRWSEKLVLKNCSNASNAAATLLPDIEAELPFPASFSANNSVVIGEDTLRAIVADPKAQVPRRFSELQCDFSREQKLQIYEHVVQNTEKLLEPELTVAINDEADSSMTFAEIVAIKKREKKLKRRKYRTSKPTHIEEVRNLVELQMQALEQYLYPERVPPPRLCHRERDLLKKQNDARMRSASRDKQPKSATKEDLSEKAMSNNRSASRQYSPKNKLEKEPKMQRSDVREAEHRRRSRSRKRSASRERTHSKSLKQSTHESSSRNRRHRSRSRDSRHRSRSTAKKRTHNSRSRSKESRRNKNYRSRSKERKHRSRSKERRHRSRSKEKRRRSRSNERRHKIRSRSKNRKRSHDRRDKRRSRSYSYEKREVSRKEHHHKSSDNSRNDEARRYKDSRYKERPRHDEHRNNGNRKNDNKSISQEEYRTKEKTQKRRGHSLSSSQDASSDTITNDEKCTSTTQNTVIKLEPVLSSHDETGLINNNGITSHYIKQEIKIDPENEAQVSEQIKIKGQPN